MEEKSVENSGPAAVAGRDKGPASAGGDILIGTDGAVGLVTLNRPAALNALTTAMRAAIAEAVPRWARDPQIYAVVIASASERAFCAGGDIKETTQWGRSRKAEAVKSLAAEYALNWLLECFTKPTVSLIDGVVIGSGVGISLYGTHRVAGERYRFAMPETGIGLFPDDGVSWAFARMPDEIGMYLALTGRAIGRADAYRLGLVTHCIPAARFGEIPAALAAADTVDPLLDDRHQDPGPGELEALRGTIARCFAADTVEGIVERLRAERGSLRSLGGRRRRRPVAALADLAQDHPSPRSLGAQARSARNAAGRTFGSAAGAWTATTSTRACAPLLIDRDQAPKWQPARLEDVSEAMVDAYFAPLGPDELELPSRAEMQAVRT